MRTPLGPDGKPLPYMANSPLAHGITMAMWGAVSKKADEERARRLAEKLKQAESDATHHCPQCKALYCLPAGDAEKCWDCEVDLVARKSAVTELVQGPDGVWRVPECNSTT